MSDPITTERYFEGISLDRVCFTRIRKFQHVDLSQIDFDACIVTTDKGTKFLPIDSEARIADLDNEHEPTKEEEDCFKFSRMQVTLWKVLEPHIYSGLDDIRKSAKYNEMVRANFFIASWFASDSKVVNFTESLRSANFEIQRPLNSSCPSYVAVESFYYVVTSLFFPLWDETLKEVCPNVCAIATGISDPFKKAFSELLLEHIEMCYVLIPKDGPTTSVLRSAAYGLLDSLESGLQFAKYLTAFNEEIKFIFLNHFALSEVRYSLTLLR